MLAGGRLAVAVLPGLVVFSLLDVAFSAAMQLATTSFEARSSMVRLMFLGLVGALLKIVPIQASLALIVAKSERTPLTTFSALREALAVWPRSAWAMVRWFLQIGIGCLVFLIPGLWFSVRLMYGQIAALRVKSDDPLEVSHETLTGHFLEGLITAVLGYGSSTMLALVTGVVAVVLRGQSPIITWSAHLVSWSVLALFANGLLNGFFYAAFVMTTYGSGRTLEPMAWHTSPSRVQPSQS